MQYESAVIIPTCGMMNTIGTSASTFFLNSSPENIYVIHWNPKDKEEMEHTRANVLKAKSVIEMESGSVINLLEVYSDTPVGFGYAVNKAFGALVEHVGGKENLPPMVVVANDDITVPEGWLIRLRASIETQRICTRASLAGVSKPLYCEPKTVGMVGPMSDNVPTLQKLAYDKKYEEYAKLKNQPVEVVNSILKKDPNRCNIDMDTQFLSGFCFALSKECLLDACDERHSFSGFLDDANFPVGGFEDNDLVVRVLDNGYKITVAQDLFVAHQGSVTLDDIAKDQGKGLANRVRFYKKYMSVTQKHQRVIGVYRVAIKCVNDLAQMRSSIQKASTILDGFSILLTNNPGEALSSYDGSMASQLPVRERQLLENSKNTEDVDTLAELFGAWCLDCCADVCPDGFLQENISCESWKGEFNERDERNRTHEMAEELGAEWIFSIDHDEVFEDRITRKHINRCVNNPNPQVIGYRVGWINHWETMSLYRVDRPFCETYKHGMQGVRLWRVFANNPTRIRAGTEIGLHCGNSPEITVECQSGTLIRFRHLSHVRAIDRYNKAEFYNTIDKEKNEILVGGSDYSHLVRGEAVPVSLYNPHNGLAFSMLSYEKENEFAVVNWLEQMSCKADRMAIVWTGEWAEEDKEWLNMPIEQLPDEEDWYKTGPGYYTAFASVLFNVEWIHTPMVAGYGLANCRNSAIDHFIGTNEGYLGWQMFMDPDESVMQGFEAALVRCTEASDVMGWLFRFKNRLADGSFADSENMRLMRLSPAFRLHGRVHETYEQSLSMLKAQGVQINIQHFPSVVINEGLSGDPDAMKAKLKKYQGMLLNELHENPYHSASWLSLALQFQNDGHKQQMMTCLERACLTSGTAFMPFREMGVFHMREAIGYLLNALKRCEGTEHYAMITDMVKALQKMAPEFRRVDTGVDDLSADVELPPFPYDNIEISENGEVVFLDEGKS